MRPCDRLEILEPAGEAVMTVNLYSVVLWNLDDAECGGRQPVTTLLLLWWIWFDQYHRRSVFGRHSDLLHGASTSSRREFLGLIDFGVEAAEESAC